jgi:hypothetical protein
MGFDGFQRGTLKPGGKPDLIPELHQLTVDPSARVRAMAARTAVHYCHVIGAGPTPDPAELMLVAECLHSKNPEVRSAAVEGILLLPTEFIGDLTSSPDPQVRVTASLMLEWPKGARDFKANVHVPVEVAAVALYGPSHSIRYLGIRSLFRKDPTDPTRPDRAIQAILKVANDRQNDEAAIEALDVLVPKYCGLEVPSRFSAPKGQVPWPIYLTRLVMSAMKGPAPERLKVIHQIGSGGAKYLCGRWDLFRRLLEDSDPTIRAEAFSVARGVTFAAAASKGVPIPSAAPATSPASK